MNIEDALECKKISEERWATIGEDLPKEITELFALCRFSTFLQCDDLAKFNTCLYFHLKTRPEDNILSCLEQEPALALKLWYVLHGICMPF